MDGSLFRVVDATELEATVLQDAEKQARNATIPKFAASRGLGFNAPTLGKFCSTTNSLVLRLAADATRQEGRELRDSGVANLAARDKVQSIYRVDANSSNM